MGTIKSGRVLNTRGAAGSASQFSVVHSNEGGIYEATKEWPYSFEERRSWASWNE